MTGHETPNVSKVEVEIPSDLYDLCLHLGKHAGEEPATMLELTAVMGLAILCNDLQKMCFSAHMLQYLQTHGKRLGVHNEERDDPYSRLN